MIEFKEYAKVCNNYCVAYFGYCNDYLVQLGLLRPILELNFPNINIYIGCRDESFHILTDDPKIINFSELKVNKKQFAHINEILFDGINHPVEKFLMNSGIDKYQVSVSCQPDYTGRCVILTKSFHPTKDLTISQIERAKIIAASRGFSIDLNGKAQGAAMAIGVEHPELFKAAALGIETMLVPTGIGTRLYKKMFPEANILDIH